jgi:hypothetical protein
MSPTSYQAAPPRNTTIAEQQSRVKSASRRKAATKPRKLYQVLYGVPSIDEVIGELECTSTMPLFV